MITQRLIMLERLENRHDPLGWWAKRTILELQDKIDQALVHLQRGSELDVVKAIEVLK